MSKKELIRLTAIDLFADKGFYNTSTPMIAEAAQISIGTIYNYFKNKDEILDYIFLVEYERREAYLLDLEKQDIPVTEKVPIFIENIFSYIKRNPNCAKVIIHGVMNPKCQRLEHVHNLRNYLTEVFTKLLDSAQQKGEIPNINPGLVGPAIFYSIRSAAYSFQSSMGSLEYDMAVEELKDYIKHALQS